MYCVLCLVLGLTTGLNVVEVAHDFQQQIKRYIVEDLKMLNSFDTWHGELLPILECQCTFEVYFTGTKNVAKSLAKATKGRGIDVVKDELLDKRM